MINIKRLFFITLFFACFFKSESINAQKFNQYNSNNERTGVWKKYYPNKRVRYVGQFENGKEIGVFKFYHITTSKHPIAVKTFYKNSDSLFVQFYRVNGKLESEGILKGKNREGVWKYFFSDGNVMSKENYKGGKLDGEQTTFYPDGKITELSMFRNGLKEGVARKYSDKGTLIEEVTYTNDKPNGLAKYFELNGNLKESGNYKNGKREGNWEYYMDGEVADPKEKKKTYNRKKGE